MSPSIVAAASTPGRTHQQSRRYVCVAIRGKKFPLLVDTGSQVSILSERVTPWEVTSAAVGLRGVGGESLGVRGMLRNELISLGPVELEWDMYVADVSEPGILGMDILQYLNAVVDFAKGEIAVDSHRLLLWTAEEVAARSRNSRAYVSTVQVSADVSTALSTEQRKVAEQLCDEFRDVLSSGKLGFTTLAEHAIELTDDVPVKIGPHPTSASQKRTMWAELQAMKEQGVVEPSSGPWSAPVVLLNKADGTKRFCIDYRKLNAKTKKDAYPMPRQEDVFDSLQGARFFCTLDLKSGYWQVGVRPSDREKTAFVVPGAGLWQFVRMPFGLCNAVATFQRLMERVLHGLIGKGVHVFVDDVVVYGTTFKETCERLREVLTRFRDAGLTLQPKKCHFFYDQVSLLGHVVSPQGLRPNPEKVQAVTEWPQPKNKKQVRKFLGLCSYYRRFIEGFAKIAGPLHALTGSEVEWRWEDVHSQAFETLKKRLSSAPVLCIFDESAPVVIDTDASGTGIGAVLSQQYQEGERVVAYYSRCLHAPERNYCATRRELLAVVEALKHFRHYVMGRPFQIRTDHSALTWLKTFKEPQGQLARWLERLSEYDVQITYRKGSCNGNADALSRRPCEPSCAHCSNKERRAGSETKSGTVANVVRLDSPPEWTTAQQADPLLKEVTQWVVDGERPHWEQVSARGLEVRKMWAEFSRFTMEGGVLCHRFYLGDGSQWVQVVVPSQLRPEVLHGCHDLSGHWGVPRTENAVQQRFWWVHWRRDVRRYVAACDTCNRQKGPHPRPHSRLQRYAAGSPLQRVAMDILGPLPPTPRGNKYLLVVVDYFTKWPEAYPIPNQEAETIADVLVEHFFCRFGIPLELHTDQGKNFDSNLLKSVCSRLSIYKTRTTAYHPESDGITERANRTILSGLIKLCEAQTDWDKVAPLVLMHYRASIHAATGFSPAQMMFGRELQVPLDVLFPPALGTQPATPASYVERLENRLEAVSKEAQEKLAISWDRAATQSPPSRHLPPIDPSRSVYVYNPARKKGVSPKLTPVWHGPFTVVDQLTDGLFRVQFPGRRGTQVVHRNHIFQPSGLSRPVVRT